MERSMEEVLSALRSADAAGNEEDAKRLAAIADRMRQTKTLKPEPEKFGILESMGVGAEKSLAGLPIRGLRELGVIEPPPKRETQKLPEAIGRGIGEVAGYLLPMGIITKGIAGGVGLASEISKNIFSTMVRHPWLTMGSEITGGVGMGGGEYAGEKLFPEIPAAKPIGGMVGGITGGFLPGAITYTPTMLALRHGRNLLKKISLPFTEPGAMYRAGEFLKKQVVKPITTAQKVVEPTIGKLPPSVASGEKRLIALYRDLLTKDPVTEQEAIKNLSQSFQKLEKEMRSLGFGTPDALKEIINKRIASIELGMDRRVSRAMEEAQVKLSAIPIARRKFEESRIVREELDKVMGIEKSLERELWADVPKDFPVGIEKTRASFTQIVDDLSTAQKTDIPLFLKKNKIISGEEEITTLREMQGLRSKLLEQGRIARATKQRNKERICNDIADAILEDIGIAGTSVESSEAGSLQTALSATRRFKERFERGIVGKILGYERTGAPSVSPDITLDISIGRMGIRGALDLEKVAVTPEAISSTKKYLARSFTDHALDKKTGFLNPTRAEEWIKSNEAILDKLPDLRTSLSGASTAQKLANKTIITMEVRKKALQNPKISIANKFLNTDMGKEVNVILKSNNPSKMLDQLVRQARKDLTGNSTEGLRAGFIDYMLEKSSIGPSNGFGEKTLSGMALKSFIKQHSSLLRQLFSPEQMSRMDRIVSELSNLEMVERISGIGIDVKLEDITSNFLRLASRIGGAQIGRIVARATGGGTVQTPAILSERFRNIATRLTKDHASQLVVDAILSEDGKLLQSLLLPITKPGTVSNLRFLDQRLNLWLMSSGSRVMDDIIDEDKELREEVKSERRTILPSGIQR